MSRDETLANRNGKSGEKDEGIRMRTVVDASTQTDAHTLAFRRSCRWLMVLRSDAETIDEKGTISAAHTAARLSTANLGETPDARGSDIK